MEQIIILSLLVIPMIYRYCFWLYVIQLKEYRWDRLIEYFRTLQWKKAIMNIWFYIEVPLLIVTLVTFFNDKAAWILFYIVSAYLLVRNIHIIIKFIRWKVMFPKLTGRMMLVSSLTFWFLAVAFSIILATVYNFIYPFIFILFTFPYIFIIAINSLLLPVVNIKKKKIVKEACKIWNSITKPIKVWITWSYGKTTVKEFLCHMLEWDDVNLLKTPEFVNSELWVASLVKNKLKNTYDYFICEMWAYKIWEIDTMWRIVDHTDGFLTAIWNQHLWLFGWIENTKKAKLEIWNSVAKNKGHLYVNWDDKNIRTVVFPEWAKVVKYSVTEEDAHAKSNIKTITSEWTKFEFVYKWKSYDFETNLIWDHNILNLTGILAFCMDHWVSESKLRKNMMDLEMPKHTLVLKNTTYKWKKILIVDDSHNLSEASLFSGIRFLKYFKWEKVAIVDDILELWKDAEDVHYKVGKFTAKRVDKVMYVWQNYRTSYVAGLIAANFDQENIITSVDEINDKSVVLLEWRWTEKYLDILS